MKTKQTQNQMIFEALRWSAKIENLSKLVDAIDEISDELYSFNSELSREIDNSFDPVKEKIYNLIYQESKRVKNNLLFEAK
jgi:hypothetical protein